MFPDSKTSHGKQKIIEHALVHMTFAIVNEKAFPAESIAHDRRLKYVYVRDTEKAKDVMI